MLNIDAIESINFEQLATATDRMLLRGGFAKRRPTQQRIAQTDDNTRAPSELWRRFTTTALVTALVSVSAAIASLL